MNSVADLRPNRNMTRLLIHVEGETEETFVNEVLAPHLRDCGFSIVGARLLGNARQRDRRGGIRSWEAIKKDIVRHLKQDGGSASATFVDYYALPASGDGAWPGRAAAASAAFENKATLVESGLLADVGQVMGEGCVGRFIPYVVMHEFEGLLFSDPEAFGTGIGRADLVPKFQAIRDQFASPEEINDSPIMAPSKRIIASIPNYQKPLLGTLAALEIGLEKMRSECPLFDAWVNRLEQWVKAQAE